jgi:hypothetical protein
MSRATESGLLTSVAVASEPRISLLILRRFHCSKPKPHARKAAPSSPTLTPRPSTSALELDVTSVSPLRAFSFETKVVGVAAALLLTDALQEGLVPLESEGVGLPLGAGEGVMLTLIVVKGVRLPLAVGEGVPLGEGVAAGVLAGVRENDVVGVLDGVTAYTKEALSDTWMR